MRAQVQDKVNFRFPSTHKCSRTCVTLCKVNSSTRSRHCQHRSLSCPSSIVRGDWISTGIPYSLLDLISRGNFQTSSRVDSCVVSLPKRYRPCYVMFRLSVHWKLKITCTLAIPACNGWSIQEYNIATNRILRSWLCHTLSPSWDDLVWDRYLLFIMHV